MNHGRMDGSLVSRVGKKREVGAGSDIVTEVESGV